MKRIFEVDPWKVTTHEFSKEDKRLQESITIPWKRIPTALSVTALAVRALVPSYRPDLPWNFPVIPMTTLAKVYPAES